jgi:hypothetical protein
MCYYIVKKPRKKTNKTKNTRDNAPSGVIPVHVQHNITTYNSENFHNKHMYSGGTKNLK